MPSQNSTKEQLVPLLFKTTEDWKNSISEDYMKVLPFCIKLFLIKRLIDKCKGLELDSDMTGRHSVLYDEGSDMGSTLTWDVISNYEPDANMAEISLPKNCDDEPPFKTTASSAFLLLLELIAQFKEPYKDCINSKSLKNFLDRIDFEKILTFFKELNLIDLQELSDEDASDVIHELLKKPKKGVDLTNSTTEKNLASFLWDLVPDDFFKKPRVLLDLCQGYGTLMGAGIRKITPSLNSGSLLDDTEGQFNGYDINRDRLEISKLLLLSSESIKNSLSLDRFNINCENSLNAEMSSSADVVVINPPFTTSKLKNVLPSSKINSLDRSWEISKNTFIFAFILKGINALNNFSQESPKHLIALTDYGALNRKTSKTIIKRLLGTPDKNVSNLIKAVIGLPGGISKGQIPVNALVLGSDAEKDKVFFINATGPEFYREQNGLKIPYYDKILKIFNNKEEIPGVSGFVLVSKLSTLDPKKYFKPQVYIEIINIQEVEAEISGLTERTLKNGLIISNLIKETL